MDRGIDRGSIYDKANTVKCQLKKLRGEYMGMNCKILSAYL